MARFWPNALTTIACLSFAGVALAEKDRPCCANCIGAAVAPGAGEGDPDPADWVPMPMLITELEPEQATLYTTGERVMIQPRAVWRPMCGSDPAAVTIEELEQAWERHQADFADANEVEVLGAGRSARGSGLNILFNLSPAVPAVAEDALAEVEAYIESQFGDPVTVSVNVTFDSLGGGVLGFASSSSSDQFYSTVRNSLQNGADGNDTIQDDLPGGSSIPVRYTSTSQSVTNENVITVNRATFKATIGSLSTGVDVSITINSDFNWDYDPSNGVPGNRTCFQSVMVHEVGHGLGFVTDADSFFASTGLLDIYRFARNDTVSGNNIDANPDNLSEFASTARMIDADDPSTSADNFEVDPIIDFISVEYRMADGFPNQASHFREQSNNIGIMDPSIASGTTFFPNFYRTSDLTAFDAIGWDFPPAAPTDFGPIFPVNGDPMVQLDAIIQWEQAVGASQYTLLIDDNSNFSSPAVNVTTGTNTEYQLQPADLDPNTQYFWRVDAINGIGTTSITPSGLSFTTTVAVPGSFNLTSPPNLASDVDVAPLLEWNPSVGVDEYRVQVSVSTLFLTNPVDLVVPGGQTSFQVAGNALDPNTTYFWRVIATNVAGDTTSVPSAARFTTADEQEPVNTCTFDFNNDGFVDGADFGDFGAAFGASTGDPSYSDQADSNDDGVVDGADFGDFGAEFGRADCLD